MGDTRGIAEREGDGVFYLTLTLVLSRQGRGKIEKPLPSREMSSLSRESHLLIPLLLRERLGEGDGVFYLTLTSVLSRQGRGKIEKPLPSREMSSLSRESHLLIPLPLRERLGEGKALSPCGRDQVSLKMI